jgi:NADPH:quinone reductase-like Zn-dependent oxidoreductase
MTTTNTPVLPATMHAVLLTGIGGPEKLQYCTNVPVPRPGPHEVLVRVGAAGVNNTDINTRIGWYNKSVHTSTEEAAMTPNDDLQQQQQQQQQQQVSEEGSPGTWKSDGMASPRIQGADVAGRVVAVGSNVEERIWMGQRVLVDPSPRPDDNNNDDDGKNLEYLGSTRDGGFAQFCAVPVRSLHIVSGEHVDHMTDAELATFPCSYSTAENLLTRSNCTATDIVLVTGASGGVGSAVVQLAHARGATVYAVASAGKAEAVLKQLGATKVVDRGVDLVAALGRESVTLVIDVVGGPKWSQLLDVLKRQGRLAVSGAVAGPIVDLDLRTLYLKDLTLYGCTGLGDGVFANLVALINSGRIKPILAETFPLAQIHQAQEVFLQKKYIGKLVLLPPTTPL